VADLDAEAGGGIEPAGPVAAQPAGAASLLRVGLVQPEIALLVGERAIGPHLVAVDPAGGAFGDVQEGLVWREGDARCGAQAGGGGDPVWGARAGAAGLLPAAGPDQPAPAAIRGVGAAVVGDHEMAAQDAPGDDVHLAIGSAGEDLGGCRDGGVEAPVRAGQIG